MADAPVVATRSLARRFGRKQALAPLDLDVAAGCVTAMVGPNGAGKTTLVRLLFGLAEPTSGRAEVLGLHPLRDRVELRRRASLVPDEPSLPRQSRVRDVLAMGAALHSKWDAATCASLVQRFALPLDRLVKQLSRGELGKLSFLVGAASRPELLVLDEPTSGLDPLVRHDLMQVLREIAAEGRSVLFSTHVMGDVDGVADRVVVMRDGGVLAHDARDALRARFVKASLLFDGELPPTDALRLPGVRRTMRGLRELVVIVEPSEADAMLAAARTAGATDTRLASLSFDEVFVELLSEPAP